MAILLQKFDDVGNFAGERGRIFGQNKIGARFDPYADSAQSEIKYLSGEGVEEKSLSRA